MNLFENLQTMKESESKNPKFSYEYSKQVFDQIIKTTGPNPKYNDRDWWEQVVAEYTDSPDFDQYDVDQIVNALLDYYSKLEQWDDRRIPNTGSIDDGIPSNMDNGGIPYESDDNDDEELNDEQLSSWADRRMDELERKGRKNWDMDDWDSYNYIQGVNAESDYFESKSTRVCESELKPFTSRDWMGFQGANKFSDGSEPMIAYGEFGTLIVSGSDDSNDGVLITIYFGEDDIKWGWKAYNDKETALKDAKFLVRLLDDEIDEAQLNRFGFELM